MPLYPEKLVEKVLLSTKNIDQPHNSRRKPVKSRVFLITFEWFLHLSPRSIYTKSTFLMRRISNEFAQNIVTYACFSTDLRVFYQRLPILSECAT